MDIQVGRLLPGMERRHTPVSDYLVAHLRPVFRDYLPDEGDYEMTFDRFEYLFALVFADLERSSWGGGGWGAPPGRFAWRRQSRIAGPDVVEVIAREMESLGSNWPPLKAGMFNSSLEQAQQAKAQFDLALQKMHFY